MGRAAVRAGAWPGLGSVAIQRLYRGLGWQLCHNRDNDIVLQHGLRYGWACAAIRPRSLRHGSPGTTHDTVGCALQISWACAATRPGVRCDTPTIWSGEGHDTTKGRLRHDAWCTTTRPAPCAAWATVCTWCTRLCFDSVHCF